MKLNQSKPARPGAHPEPTEAEIQKIAYCLWLEKGCPDGNDLDNWLEAKELIRHRTSARPGTVQTPAAIHFPGPHGTASLVTTGPGGASAHLDFRHSVNPFQPSKAT